MIKYSLAEKKLEQVLDATPDSSNFGKVNSRFRYEYIHLYVKDIDDNLLTSKIIPSTDFEVTNNSVIDLNIGEDLRELGYNEGKYKVQYYFLNEVAGSTDGAKYPYYYLKNDNTPQWGAIKKDIRDNKEYCYILNSDGTTEIPLKKKANKYVLLEHSADKTEVMVDVQNIAQWDYQNRLHSITRRKRYPRWQDTNAAGGGVDGKNALKYPAAHWKRDKNDPYILELIPQYDQDPGFDPEVEGISLYIDDVFTFQYEYDIDDESPEVNDPNLPPEVLAQIQQSQESAQALKKKVAFNYHYRTTVVEVLDYNKIKVDKSFEDYEGEIRGEIQNAIENEGGVFTYYYPQGSRAERRPDQNRTIQLNGDLATLNASQFEQVADLDRILRPIVSTGEIVRGAREGEEVSRMRGNSWGMYIPNVDVNRLNLYMVVNDEYYLVTNISEGYGKDGLITSSEAQLGFAAPRFWKGGVGVINPGACQRYFKLAQPLSKEISPYDLVYFVEEGMPVYEDMVQLVPFEEEDLDLQFLRIPNLNSKDNPIRSRKTNFKSFTELQGDTDNIRDRLSTKIFSSSLLDTELNIPYGRRDAEDRDFNDYGFKQIVQYGSAEKRIDNFWDKINSIEAYESESVRWTAVSSSSTNRDKYRKLKNGVINSFDHFENYIYETSGSYVTSSIGEFYNVSFPKKSTKVSNQHIPMSISSSKATAWYSNWKSYGQGFDTINQERIVKNLPAHVTEDSTNKVFMDFMDMIGQQFDETWVYSRHFTDVNERASMLTEGISKDITEDVAKGLGLNLINGNDLLELPQYLLGTNATGSSVYAETQENITKEIYKRILGSLPYLSRTKGTIRSLKGLINCYGIPSSILRVREYGGPNLPGQRVSYEIKRKFNYALDFKGGQYVNHTWKADPTAGTYPDTVEFRFRTPYSVGNSGSMALVQANEQWGIYTKDNGLTDAYGHLNFGISGSDGSAVSASVGPLPFYNDDMWSVMLTRVSSSGAQLVGASQNQKIKYELTAKQYDSTREVILYKTSGSVIVDGSGGSGTSGYKQNDYWTTSVGARLGGWANGKFGSQFSGSLMEYRLWTEPLSQSIFDNHVLAPKSYVGNTTSSHYDNLVFRLPLNDNVELTNSDTLDDKSNKRLYLTSASVNGFGGNNFFRSLVDKEQLKIPNIGPQRRNATKIRIEDQQLGNRMLSPETRVAASEFDLAPLDSNKVGIYFSPVDVINEDIIYSLADFDFDDLVGDPRDKWETDFRGLEKAQRDYWRKYSQANNFFDYLRILKYYDSGIFDQIRTFIPARVNATLGVLVEPNLLERDKEIIGHIPQIENTYYENAGHFDAGLQISNNKSGSDAAVYTLGGEFYQTEGTINAGGYGEESGANGSLAINTLNVLDQHDPIGPFGNTYLSASITFGGTISEFTEATQPIIDSARLSEHYQVKNKFYSSKISASLDLPYSASFSPSEFESMAKDSNLFRVYYKPITLTKNNTIDGKEPVEVTITSPTVLISQEPGESPLIVE
tara:strand:+ start:4273 stop:8790 length:4518 start_codon:yes stop_codon:yes gene_type:complete